MEEGAAYAAMYAAPLAVVVGIAVAAFVKVTGPLEALGPMLNWGLMILIWWKLWFIKYQPESDFVREADGTIRRFTIAWPWYAPLGGFVAFVFGYLLADRRERTNAPLAMAG